MKTLSLKQLILSAGLIVTLFFVGVSVANASAMFANGNLGYNGTPGGGGNNECPLAMIANFNGEGVATSPNSGACWATSISPVQAGGRFNVKVNVKNVGTTPATNVRVSIMPGSANTAVSGRTFTATVTGIDPTNQTSSQISASRTVSVSLASSQTIIADEARHYSGFGNYQILPLTSVLSANGASIGNLGAGQMAEVLVAFDIGNATNNNNGGLQVQNGGQINANIVQVPSIQTISTTLPTSGVTTLKGKCNQGPITQAWFNIQNLDTGNLSSTATMSQSSCTNFDYTTTLSDTHYKYQACGSNIAGQSCGAWITLTKNSVQASVPTIQTVSTTLPPNGVATLKGKCVFGPISQSWFNIQNLDTGNLSSTSPASQNTCNDFDHIITLSDTHYKYQACGSNANGTGCGSWMTLTKQGQNTGGTIDTLSASSISTSGATLRGQILTGNDFNTVWFRYATSTTGLTCSTGTLVSASGTDYDAGETFTAGVSGLNNNTTYYYRACGLNPANQTGGTMGDIEQFTTDNNNGGGGGGGGGGGNGTNYTVKTNSATNINSSSATLQGEITSGTNFDDAWFVYSKSDSTPECDNDTVADVSGNDFDDGDQWSKTVTGLSTNTAYYFRACAQRNGNDYQGSVKSFTTKNSSSSSVSINTLPATNVTSTSATAHGSYSISNCNDFKTYFRYGTSSNKMDSATSAVSQNKSSDSVDVTLNNLAWGKSYYVQFVGTCGPSAYLGDVVRFTTTGVFIPTPGKEPEVIPVAPNPDTCARVNISDDTETVIPGQYLTYRVEWNNACSDVLENTLVKVSLAPEVDFLTTSHGAYTGLKEHSVMMNISTLDSGDEGFGIINAQLKSSARPGTLAVTQADLGGKNKSDGVTSTAFDVDTIMDQNGNPFGAAAFGSGFMGGVGGWLAGLVALVLIGLGARSFYMAGARTAGPRGGNYAPTYSAPQTPVNPNTVSDPQPDPNAYTTYRPQSYDPNKK